MPSHRPLMHFLMALKMTTTKPTPIPNDVEGLTDTDIVALQRALDLGLNSADRGRAEQVQSMLEDRSWREVAMFASYHLQSKNLSLHPWQTPPCWIRDAEEANAILANGPVPSLVTGEDISDRPFARLTLKMLEMGISPFEPDPMQAIMAAERGRKRSTRR
jgi:hypothetical protein